MPQLRGNKFIAVLLFTIFTLWGFFFTNFPTWGWPGGDGRDYANITEALVEGGSFDLRFSSRPVRSADDPTVILKESGAIYSVFPMGKALAQAPLLAVARWVGKGSPTPQDRLILDNLSFSATGGILYGLSAALLFLILVNALHFEQTMALFGTGLYCLGTLAFPFSKIYGVEPLQVVLLMGLVYWGLVPSRWSLVIGAICFGWLVITKPPSAVALPVVLYLAWKNSLWQRANTVSRVAAIVAAMGFFALFSYYNWVRAGDVTASYGLGQVADSKFSLSRIPQTLWPLLIGPERNLFLNNPILILALPGLLLLRERLYLIVAAGLWLGMLVLYGASGNTNWGAYVGNGRYAVPYIFLLIPFVLVTVRALGRLGSRLPVVAAFFGIAALVCLSTYVQVLYASYSEFHVKQYERTYNHNARKLELPTLKEATHQLQFANTLFWYTDSCQKPGDLEHFPYPSTEAETAIFAAQILNLFPPRFFCKDYIFLNIKAIDGVGWLYWLRLALLAAFGVSLVLLIWVYLPGSKSGQFLPPQTGKS